MTMHSLGDWAQAEIFKTHHLKSALAYGVEYLRLKDRPFLIAKRTSSCRSAFVRKLTHSGLGRASQLSHSGVRFRQLVLFFILRATPWAKRLQKAQAGNSMQTGCPFR